MSFVTNKALKVALEEFKSESEKNLPKRVSLLENDSKYQTELEVTNLIKEVDDQLEQYIKDAEDIYQPKGEYLTEHQSLEDYSTTLLVNEKILTAIENINIPNLATKEELENKVDKIEGKQLSTEDFTTLLKEKLESLENYDDTTVLEKIEGVIANLDTLIGSDDVTTVIDTFNEIEDFLNGITNSDTLLGMLQDMKDNILETCSNTYQPKGNYLTEHLSLTGYLKTEDANKAYIKVDGSNGTGAGVSTLINKLSTGDSTPTDDDYYVSQFSGGGSTTTTFHRRPMSKLWSYIKGKSDDTYQAKGNYVTTNTKQDITKTKTFTEGINVSGRANSGNGDDEGVVIGRASNNYAGVTLGEASGKRATFYLTPDDTVKLTYNNGDGTSTVAITHPKTNGVIATQEWTNNNSVQKTGDTMTGKLTIGNSTTKGEIFSDNTYGTWIQYGSDYINVKNGNLYWKNANKFWHAGNDGSSSGLDADLLDGLHGSSYVKGFSNDYQLTCSGSGTYSYVEFATLTIGTTYANYPIIFEISGRGIPNSFISVTFASASNNDPELGYFTTTASNRFYIKKSTTSTWKLYAAYTETWGSISIRLIYGKYVNSGITIAIHDTGLTSLPSGCTQVSNDLRGSLWTLGTAITGTSTTNTSYATGIASATAGDMYLNTSTGHVYRCTTGGNATTAKWIYVGTTKYSLPIATSSVLGGVKIGDNVNIDSYGKISVPSASSSTAGVLKVGENLDYSNNTVSMSAANMKYALKDDDYFLMLKTDKTKIDNGTLTASCLRDPDYHAMANRRVSANINFNSDAGIHTFLATGTMTEGKPPEDAHVMHMEWDNSNQWAALLAIGNTGKVYSRRQNKATWDSSWKQLAFTDIATTTTDGLLSQEDKSRLDSIFEKVMSGSVTSNMTTIPHALAAGVYLIKVTCSSAPECALFLAFNLGSLYCTIKPLILTTSNINVEWGYNARYGYGLIVHPFTGSSVEITYSVFKLPI